MGLFAVFLGYRQIEWTGHLAAKLVDMVYTHQVQNLLCQSDSLSRNGVAAEANSVCHAAVDALLGTNGSCCTLSAGWLQSDTMACMLMGDGCCSGCCCGCKKVVLLTLGTALNCVVLLSVLGVVV